MAKGKRKTPQEYAEARPDKRGVQISILDGALDQLKDYNWKPGRPMNQYEVVTAVVRGLAGMHQDVQAVLLQQLSPDRAAQILGDVLERGTVERDDGLQIRNGESVPWAGAPMRVLRMSDQALDALRALAEERGMDNKEVLKRALDWFLSLGESDRYLILREQTPHGRRLLIESLRHKAAEAAAAAGVRAGGKRVAGQGRRKARKPEQ